jgi:hypothetical protein
LLNRIGDYQTTLEGVIAPEREGWMPRFCMSQPFVEGETPSELKIREAFESCEFFHVSAGAYYSPGEDVLLTDAFPRNVRLLGGAPIPFDAVASIPAPVERAWLEKKLGI